jgi:hypothetical protein
MNLIIRDAVIQGIEISPVPRWRADDAEERVRDVVLAVPCRPIPSQLHHEYRRQIDFLCVALWSRLQLMLSTTIAIPCPPPMHADASPYFFFRRRNS